MEERLIEEVRKYDFLYDVQSKDYRDQRKRQEAWEEIGKTIQKKGQECKDAWTKLRNAYTNALNRRKTTTTGQSSKKIAKWKYEDQMSFLVPSMECRSSYSILDSQYGNIAESQTSESDKNVTDDQNQLEDEDDTHEESFNNATFGSSSDHAKPNHHGPYRTPPTLTKRRIEKAMVDFVDIMKSNNRRDVESLTLQTNDVGDEIDLFFLSLAKTVKKLPDSEQVRLKMGISNLVFEAELRNTYCSVPQLRDARGSTNVSLNSPVPSPSSVNSYSNQSEIVVFESKPLHRLPYTEPNIGSDPLFIQDSLHHNDN